jgi:salicylate hydroxylase
MLGLLRVTTLTAYLLHSFNTLITTVEHTSSDKPPRACVHRAKILEGLIELIPPSTTYFGKSLKSISDVSSTGQLSLNFADGSTAVTDAIIACDGIKSVARQNYVLSGTSDQDISRPSFTGDVAYRGMFPCAQFTDIVGGSISSGKGSLFCGPQSYVVMYPVERGSLMNIVAMKHMPDQHTESPSGGDKSNWIQPVSHETMISDFEGWGTPIKSLLRHMSPERWALYDHLPVSTFVKGRVALMGDAAHATTPHQGQGAGMAFEDSLILSNILGKVLGEPLTTPSEPENDSAVTIQIHHRIQSCLYAYDEVRRSRTQRITATSREMGNVIGFTGDGIGKDLAKLKANLDTRMNWIWDIDLPGEIARGVEYAKNLHNSS